MWIFGLLKPSNLKHGGGNPRIQVTHSKFGSISFCSEGYIVLDLNSESVFAKLYYN